MHELAYFRGNDESCLVAATLACSVCLSADVEWVLEVADFDGLVHCRCRSCGHERRVSLTADQTLRLSLEAA